jgi:hypothetical protein
MRSIPSLSPMPPSSDLSATNDEHVSQARGHSRDRDQCRLLRSSSSHSPQYSSEKDDKDVDALIDRIRSGIAYTRPRKARNLPCMQTTRFSIPRRTDIYKPSPSQARALLMLDSSHAATLILTSSTHVVYELGVPITSVVAEGLGVLLVHRPSWWVGKPAAEVKAGPHADEKDLRRAEEHLKRIVSQKLNKVAKTARQRAIDWKLKEGLQRQEVGLDMHEANSGDGSRKQGSTINLVRSCEGIQQKSHG